MGIAVVCSFKDLERESKSRGWAGSGSAPCLTAGSSHTPSCAAAACKDTALWEHFGWACLPLGFAERPEGGSSGVPAILELRVSLLVSHY